MKGLASAPALLVRRAAHRTLLVTLALGVPAAAHGQGTSPARPGAAPRMVTLYHWSPAEPGATIACAASPANDLASLDDDFARSGAPAANGWQWFHEVNGWPTMMERADVGTSLAGHLTLQPRTSGWFEDYHGPLLYKDVSGNFDVTVRLRASGVADGDTIPGRIWSLAGLMVRAPRRVSPADWTPGRENWLFITTGIGEAPGVPVIETKNTANSRSNLKLRRGRAGWNELRIVRLNETFLLLARAPGGAWEVRERFMRKDMPRDVQVGLVAYTDGTSAPPELRAPLKFNTQPIPTGRPDLKVHVDWVRFRRPPQPRGVATERLTDYAVSNDAILGLLACGERPA